jgi:hypothetical protein
MGEDLIKEEVEKVEKVEGEKGVKQPELTYEQLHTIAVQATQQAEMFQRELQKYQNESLYIRLDFLFKVLTTSDRFSVSFVKKCADEVELLLTIPEQK